LLKSWMFSGTTMQESNPCPKIQILPEDDIRIAAEKEALNDKMSGLLQYCEKTYFGYTDASGVKKAGRFPIRSFNKREEFLQMESTTTNMSESFNLYLTKTTKQQANIWKLLKSLIEEESLARDKISKANRGLVPTYLSTGRHNKVVRKKEALKALVETYSRDNVSFGDDVMAFYNGFFIE